MRYKPVLLLIGATLCALSAAARPPLPSLEQRRLAHIVVADEDYYLPLPLNYSGEQAGGAPGPHNSWFRVHMFPRGQTEADWTEMMTFIVFAGPAQPLSVAQASLHKSCVGSFGAEAVPVPSFVAPQGAAKAEVMSCSNIVKRNGPAIYGYYLAINGKNHSYLLTRERRDMKYGRFMDWKEQDLPQWTQALARFSVCAAGSSCVMDANQVVTNTVLHP